MYQVPLRFIRVSSDAVACATRITYMSSTTSYQARETIKNERRAGTLLNACGNKASKTAIILDNGAVISSPLELGRLLSAIDKANTKGESSRRTKRTKVNDVAEEEPNEEINSNVIG